jgi:hypothetical protein
MKNKFMYLLAASSVLMAAMFSSCEEDTVEEIINSTQTYPPVEISRAITYTVLVVDGNNSSLKAAQGVAGATVTVNGTTATTGASGQATFTSYAGASAVTVSLSGYSTCNYIVDLVNQSAEEDSSDRGLYDNNKMRTAATKVVMFPLMGTPGAELVTISGTVKAQLDVSGSYRQASPAAPGTYTWDESEQLELIPDSFNLQITAEFNPSGGVTEYEEFNNTGNYISGNVIDVTYEDLNTTTTVVNGRYSINVPATAAGASTTLHAQQFLAGIIFPVQVFTVTGTGTAATATRTQFTSGNYIGLNQYSTIVVEHLYPADEEIVSGITTENVIRNIEYANIPKATTSNSIFDKDPILSKNRDYLKFEDCTY